MRTMGCLVFLIGLTTPRLGLFVFWVLRPERVEAAFDTFLIPLAGIVVVPTATFLYAVLDSSAGGVTAWGWFWIVVAAFFDLLHGFFALSDIDTRRARRR
jgi:hypothetical protein